MQLSEAPPIFQFFMHPFLSLPSAYVWFRTSASKVYQISTTFSCTDLSQFFTSSSIYIYVLFSESVSHGFGYLYFAKNVGILVIVVGTAGIADLDAVLLGLALSFCAIRGFAAAVGCTSVCSPLETSPERAGARARDRDGERRRDEDGIETDGQSRGVETLWHRG